MIISITEKPIDISIDFLRAKKLEQNCKKQLYITDKYCEIFKKIPIDIFFTLQCLLLPML